MPIFTLIRRSVLLSICVGWFAFHSYAFAQVNYSRDIAPILAEHCFECHGPDESKLEAGLRLDQRESAISELDSGDKAIVPRLPHASTLMDRIVAEDADERMPPTPREPLSQDDVELLKRWIEEGAEYGSHWSFEPLRFPAGTEGLDELVHRRRTAKGIQVGSVAPAASRGTLVRRLYFDLVGLPPTPEELDRWMSDHKPDAYARLVNELLASPHYGERWGRHWLDVARYGDSNGGDENHKLPLAYAYRNYVIQAFNDDVPFDRFLAEQIAGDLLDDDQFPDRRLERLKGTGFFAIGMKILAEKDPEKKRADLVDERIDTMGKAFLGLSIACARCHDHKFDPIPTKDYYAIAGILHSTQDEDRAIESEEYLANREKFAKQEAGAVKQVEAAQAKVANEFAPDSPVDANAIDRQAESFDRGNVVVDRDNYGKGIGVISDPGGQDNFAEYDFAIKQSGKYLLAIRYAAETARPGKLLIDAQVVKEDAIALATGGWHPEQQEWFVEQVVSLKTGDHVLRIESKPMMSHIDQWQLRRVADDSKLLAISEQLTSAQKALAELRESAPQPMKVMAISEGEVRDVRVHVRGSHLDLGEEVPRGVLSEISADGKVVLPEGVSGRRELAAWMTDVDEGAGPLVARVIANRLWHWHTGRGLVESPNDFGIRGRRPTHPELLDWLANELIENEWSLKHLHKVIVTSATYKMASQHQDPAALERDPGNRWYWRRQPRRLEAEAIRDAALVASGRIDRAVGGQSIEVKSQDPSPGDLAKNQKAYRECRRRSVYLPVVRTNVYDFFTLFDFPVSASPVGKRTETAIPTQSLLMMNDPFLIAQSEALAKAALKRSGSAESSIDFVYKSLFGRSVTGAEVSTALEFLSAYETGEAERVSREESWASYCHTLMMSHEFIQVR